MTADPLLSTVTEHFISSAESNSFNGLLAERLRGIIGASHDLRAHLEQLIAEGKVNCAFARVSINPHIKRFPDLDINEQIKRVHTEDFDTFCVYPSAQVIRQHVDVTQWDDRPFSKLLALAEPQLGFRAFDMAVLERYTSDPRYVIQFDDYMGYMSIKDEYFIDDAFIDRDKVSLQSFGLGFDDNGIPHVVAFLRYLANLSPEHQQYWNSYLSPSSVRMTYQYFQSSILGEFWENRSMRYAIAEEIRIINEMTEKIWGQKIFRSNANEDVPIGLTSFLRPTQENFHHFAMALDKILSENINKKFFEGRAPLEIEINRSDGKIEAQKKGTIKLLEEWLLSEIRWEDENQFRSIIIEPLRYIRKLRQKPAHTFTTDDFSHEYYQKRKQLLCDVLNSLSNIRRTLGKHPRASSIEQPAWLDSNKIDVF